MSRESDLLGKIFELTGGALDSASFPFPQLRPVLDSMAWIRVRRMSRFWKPPHPEIPIPIERSAEDLAFGFHAQSCPWLFLIRSSAAGIECWFGAEERRLDRESLRASLAGTFPDARFHETIAPDKRSLARLRQAVVLIGVPGTSGDGRGESPCLDQIEKLCRGLYGSEWLYAVHSVPLDPVEVARALNETTARIHEVHATLLLKTSAADEGNRTARRYVELLEAQLARLEAGRTGGMWCVHALLFTENAIALGRARALLQSAFGGEGSPPLRVRPCSTEVCRSPVHEPLNSRELAILTRLPREALPGYEVIEGVRFGVEGGSTAAAPGAVRLGAIVDRGVDTGHILSIPREDLPKHGLIAGVTGSGKTNTCFALLEQVWDAGRGAPFLVIEPAKSEYRSLLRHPRFAGLRVFTVGDETVSPLRLNPFEVPPRVLVQTHLDYVKSLFGAAFVLYPPMPYVLEQSLHEIYEDRGWDLARNVNTRGENSARRFPSLGDLAAKVSVVVDRMGYDERLTMDIKAGLLARINQLRLGGGKGRMFSGRESLDLADLLSAPCVFELKSIVSDDEKAFVMGLLLIRIYEHHEGRPEARGTGLAHLTLIEEAHRLLRNVSTQQGSEISANPQGKAIEVFSNILSEIRAYGEAIYIAEQIPLKLAPDAIKNTNVKVVHRLVAEDDRRAVGAAMNLSEEQMRYLATLATGEAAVYMEGMRQPALLRIPLFLGKERAGAVVDVEVRGAMDLFWRGQRRVILPFPGCGRCLAAVPGMHCAARGCSRAGAQVHGAFAWLFNALRLNRALVFDAFTEFAFICAQQPGTAGRGSIAYCFFVELAEEEVERRGEFASWPHSAVDQFLELAGATVAALARDSGRIERGAAERACGQDLLAFSNHSRRLHKADSLPFGGCRHCSEPCQFRFDMRKAAFAAESGEFRDTFLDLQAPLEALADVAWRAGGSRISPRDVNSRRGAALCFAVQQFSELGLARHRQEDMSAEIANALSRINT